MKINICSSRIGSIGLAMLSSLLLLGASEWGRSAITLPETLDTTGDILLGTTTNSSSTHTGFLSSEAVDGVLRDGGAAHPGDNGLIFGDSDPDQRLAISGFNSAITDIRVYTNVADTGRLPITLEIASSTTSQITPSLSAGFYDPPFYGPTPTVFTIPAANNSGAGSGGSGDDVDPQIFYIDIPVSLPAGTKSLFIDIGAAGEGQRISEVMAYAPEPTSLGLFGLGSALLIARRKR